MSYIAISGFCHVLCEKNSNKVPSAFSWYCMLLFLVSVLSPQPPPLFLFVICRVWWWEGRKKTIQQEQQSSGMWRKEWINPLSADPLNLRKKIGFRRHWIVVVGFDAVSFHIFKIADALEMRLRGSIGFLIISLIFMSGNMLNSSSTASRADRKSTLMSGFITLSFE